MLPKAQKLYDGMGKSSNMVINILPADPPPRDPGGQKLIVQPFKHRHFAYRFKGNYEGSNMAADPYPPPPSPYPVPGGQKFLI